MYFPLRKYMTDPRTASRARPAAARAGHDAPAEFPKAVAKITGDEDELLAFYDYPRATRRPGALREPPLASSRRDGCKSRLIGQPRLSRKMGDEQATAEAQAHGMVKCPVRGTRVSGPPA